MKFLIVDDSRAVQSIIRRAIEKSGINNLAFETALNGELALEKIKTWHPDLVITDWHMPTMSGIDLLKSLRQNGYEKIKVGFVTTESSNNSLDEAKKNGALFVVNKPCSDEELINAIFSVFPEARSPNSNDLQSLPISNDCSDLKVGYASTLSNLFQKQLQLQHTFTPLLRQPIESVKGPFLVSIYKHQESEKVCGLSLLDRNSITLIGGHLANFSISSLKELLNDTEINKIFIDKTIEFLSNNALSFFSSAITTELFISASNVVTQPSKKLSELVDSSPSRFDYTISQIEFGNCFFSLILI